MRKENGKGRDRIQDSLSLFTSNFANKGLSWAVQIRQKLENVNLEDIATKSSARYVDAFGEQFRKMCVEVDDWLTPASDGAMPRIPYATKNHEPTSMVHIMSSEPKFSMLEPMPCEVEPIVNMVQEICNAPEIFNSDVSSERDDRNLAAPTVAAQRAWVDELLNSSTNPFEREDADMTPHVSKFAEDEHSLNAKQTLYEGRLDEESVVNSVPEGHEDECVLNASPTFTEGNLNTEELIGNLTPLSLETSSNCDENSIDEVSKGHGFSLPVDACRNFCTEELLPASNGAGFGTNKFSANVVTELVETNVSREDNSIVGFSKSVEVHQDTCVGEAHGTSLRNSISSSLVAGEDNCDGSVASGLASKGACSNSHFVSPIIEVRGSPHERFNASGRGDCSASSAAKDDVYGYGHASLSDEELNDSLSTNMEEFEDVELGDCWDDLDREEVLILSRRQKTNLSYKKKIKRTLRSISWSSKNKALAQAANPQSDDTCDVRCAVPASKNTNGEELAKDSCDSDWELV